jgi:hypothetical protein
MRLKADHEHPTPHNGRCRVRIYEPDQPGDQYVVVITELAENPGQSVTNCVEQLAAEVIMAHALPSSETAFIEHYEKAERSGESETYDLVTFAWGDPEPHLVGGVWTIAFGDPSWRPLDRESVEVLLGHSLSR